jgi:hypothetical protein
MAIHRFGRLVGDWRELEEAGIPLEPPKFRVGVYPNGGVTIRQEPAPYEIGIRVLRSGRIAYILPVFIRRDQPGKTIIRDCTIHTPWDDSIEWLDEDKKRNPGWYTFSEDCCIPKHEYARETVVNHRMICTLSRGDIREGLLLAVGKVPPPETYRDGDRIPITFSILDQWDFEPSATFKLVLERCRLLHEKIQKSTRRSLFSHRDHNAPPLPLKAPLDPAKGNCAQEIFRELKAFADGHSTMDHAGVGLKKGKGR